MNVSNCGSCKAPIIWCRTRSGKKMPVDADPVENGDFYLATAEDGKTEAHHVKGYPGKLPEGLDRYASHFSTCPDADRHRGSRR